MTQQFHFLVHALKNWKKNLKEIFLILIFTAALFTIGKKREATQVFIHGWMDKQNVACIYIQTIIQL